MGIQANTKYGPQGTDKDSVELHYKAYQKVMIYRDKIQASLFNLGTLLTIMPFSQCHDLILARMKELDTMRVSLAEFCSHSGFSLPYVPPSRCRALTSWYAAKPLFAPGNLSAFRNQLLAADQELILEAGYALKSDTFPTELKRLFQRHLNRFKRLARA